MNTAGIPKLPIIKLVLWAFVIFSAEALIYNIRWFIPYLAGKTANVVQEGKMPMLWFVAQICSNAMFLAVGIQLIFLYREYRQTGFFDKESLRVFNTVIISCGALAVLGVVQTIANTFYEVHFNEWTSVAGIANLLLRSFTRLLVLREPVTIYFPLAIILWVVKQFVTKAIILKNENESFV
jgi:hypothetical protein